MKTDYDLIVIGVGGMGSATIDYASRAGLSVLGIEQYDLGHSLGSSHGQTRAIRAAYFEKPDYVPFCKRAYKLWQELEQRCGKSLLKLNGIAMYLSKSEPGIREAVLDSANKYSIPLETLNLKEAKERWPIFASLPNTEVIYEPHAGYLLVEECIEALIEMSIKQGAVLLPKTLVSHWEDTGKEVRVESSQGVFTTRKLVVTAGPWSNQMLKGIGHKLEVYRVLLSWFEAQQRDSTELLKEMPVWMAELSNEFIYGFPMLDSRGVKAAFHMGKESVGNPSELRRTISEEETLSLGERVSEFIPELNPKATHSVACMYTMSEDEDFILDFYPNSRNVVFGAGFSGHGYKFAPCIGEYLVQLAHHEPTQVDGSFLKIRA